jgi:hypothetical protein
MAAWAYHSRLDRFVELVEQGLDVTPRQFAYDS